MQTVLSYHGDPAIKDFCVTNAKFHLASDMLATGTYGDIIRGRFRGCSIGCSSRDIDPTRTDRHACVAEHAGWPLWLAFLNDQLFERLSNGTHATFHVALREAIPVGIDLEPIRHQLAIRRLTRVIDHQALNAGQHGPEFDAALTEALTALRLVRKSHEIALCGSLPRWWYIEKIAETARHTVYEAYIATYNAAALDSPMRWLLTALHSATYCAVYSAKQLDPESVSNSAHSAAFSTGSARSSESSESWRIEAYDLLELLQLAAV